PGLRNELKHTFWILNRVASVRALARLLKKHPVFENYEIVLAAGDGKIDDIEENEESLIKVKKAIENNDKTITLSVGQLTTGVTIPEWSAVLMLSNMQSPSLYMQAAFRAQNPRTWSENVGGKDVVYQKQNAYIFDFAPERTLITFDEFANNLNPRISSGGGTSEDRKENIKRLLNFFPVIGEDTDGVMKALDYNDILTIPRKIKATEVVKRGFMSNLLFANIAGIFSAPQIVLDTQNNITHEREGKLKPTNEEVDTENVTVNEDGEAEIDDQAVMDTTGAIPGYKIYGMEIVIADDAEEKPKDKLVKDLTKTIVDSANFNKIMEEAQKTTEATKRDAQRAQKRFEEKIERDIRRQVDE